MAVLAAIFAASKMDRVETDRLVIRPYEETDFESTLALYSDPEVTCFFEDGKPKTRKEVEEIVSSFGKAFFKDHAPYGLYTIKTRDEGAFIGHIDFLPVGKMEAEVGYILCKASHGKGFATEALKVMISYWSSAVYPEGTSPPTTIMATVRVENIGSIKVLEKIGMVFQDKIIRYGAKRLVYRLNLIKPK